MAFGAVKILDVNGLSYLYTKLNNNITDFQNTSKAIIDSAAAAANNAADRANAVTGNIDNTYATKEELATAIGKITSFEFLIVSSLPNPGVKGTIYLVENTSGNQSSAENKNTYDEFIWVGSKYEKIGTTDINLSDYMNAADIADTYLSKTDASTTYATKGEVSTLGSKVDSNTANISSHSSNTTAHITAAERTNWNAAKTHADSTHARTDATNVAKSSTNGNIKINGTETTVYTHPSGTNPHGTTKADVGLGNVGNYKAVSTVASQGLSDAEKSNARTNIGAGDGNYNNLSNRPTIGNGTITIKQNGTSKGTFTMNQTGNTTIELTDTNSASGVGAIPSNQKGSANGVASLDANGKVPSSQLPSYVDDVIEGYYSGGNFYSDSGLTSKITGESGKIYLSLNTSKIYRWSGSTYAVISETLALGETSSTAYRGDRGKTAYDHSQATHARTDATNVAKSSTNGNIKINGTETTVYTHPSGTNPHGTTKSDVGLGNVGNYKAVSTVASQGLSDMEKSNARANIGAGTSSLTIGTTSSTAAAGNHTHNYAGSSSAGGVATSAAKLSTARNIALTGSVTGNANFDGSGNISISTTTNHTHNYAGSSSAGGSATSAVKLATARTITLSGAVTGSAKFDGSANITITNKVAYGTSAPSSLADGSLYCVYE